MDDQAKSPAQLVVVGANHRTSTAALRDRLFVEDAEVPRFLAELVRRGVQQCLVMSTCDRVEVQGADPAPAAAGRIIADALLERAGGNEASLAGQLYVLTDDEALRQLFAVPASLDSMVVGEPQVLGQVKACHRVAREAGTTGPELEAALQAAYAAAKRVRSETSIGRGPVSLAASAVQVARDVHGELGRCSALLVGPGELGGLVLEQFQRGGLGRLTVAGSTRARAEAAGRRLGCTAVTYDELERTLAGADVIIAAAGTGHALIDAEMVERALTRRRRRPIFLVDAAVPGDIDPLVDGVEDAFRYDLDDLEKVAREGRNAREGAARKAWEILEHEIGAFHRERQGRAAVPVLTQLRRHFEAVRAEVLAKSGSADAEQATRLLVNRLLHGPYEVLRRAAADDPECDAMEDVTKRLFRLDGAEADGGEESEK
ncbi:MAG: glutamyl-tRNA reductase [Alphaproteobacteria bacterium]